MTRTLLNAVVLAVFFAEILITVALAIAGDAETVLDEMRRVVESIDEQLVVFFYGIATVALFSLGQAGRGALRDPQAPEEAERRVRSFAGAALAAIALTLIAQTVFTVMLWESEPAFVVVSCGGALALIFLALDGAGISVRRDLRKQRRQSLRKARRAARSILSRRARLFGGRAPARALIVSAAVLLAWWSAVIAAVFVSAGVRSVPLVAAWVVTVIALGGLLAAAPVFVVALEHMRRTRSTPERAKLRGALRPAAAVVAGILAAFFLWPKGDASVVGNAIVVALAALPLLMVRSLRGREPHRVRSWAPTGAARQAFAAAFAVHAEAVNREVEAMERAFSHSVARRDGEPS